MLSTFLTSTTLFTTNLVSPFGDTVAVDGLAEYVRAIYNTSVDANRIVTSLVSVPGHAPEPGTANYLIICNK